MFKYTSKFEVNFLDPRTIASDIQQLPNVVIKGKAPTVIVAQEFIDAMLMERQRYNGKFKIIAAVDFANNGKSYALEKLKYIHKSTFQCDGIEVLLTPNRSDKECSNELKAITEFVKSVNTMMEIRWVFGLRTRKPESISNFMPYLKTFPSSFNRTDNNLDTPLATLESHIADVELLKTWSAAPVKVSGNVDLITMMNIPKASRFDVTITQARRIMNTLNQPAVFEQSENIEPHVPTSEELDNVLTEIEQLELTK